MSITPNPKVIVLEQGYVPDVGEYKTLTGKFAVVAIKGKDEPAVVYEVIPKVVPRLNDPCGVFDDDQEWLYDANDVRGQIQVQELYEGTPLHLENPVLEAVVEAWRRYLPKSDAEGTPAPAA